MFNFESVDKFKIKNRGDVYICKPCNPITHGQLDECMNQEVIIDSEIHKVIGIEKYSILYKPEQPVLCSFGLLVAFDIEKDNDDGRNL